jgi:hypothetical protein
MIKENILKLTEDGLSSYEIAKATGKSQTTIRYWLKKFNIKSSHPNKKIKESYPLSSLETEKYCPLCKTNKQLSEFYKTKKPIGIHTYCKPCSSQLSTERLRNIKIQCINYKGGKCSCCGYNKYFGALEFHHKNAKEKDFSISKSCMSFNKIKKELDKCILVCSNCHREIHAGIICIPSE